MRFGQNRLFEIESPLSGRIEVVRSGAETRLLIEGAVQSIGRSDGRRRGYWERLVPTSAVRSVLILGLGGGTVARWIKESWPRAELVGYEIDPTVVRVAKDYFSLPAEVKVFTKDFRQALKGSEKFDLIVADLYTGYRFLPEAESDETMRRIKLRLNPGGWAAFNRVGVDNGPGGLSEFEQKLQRVFRTVRIEKVNLNRIYWGGA